MDLQKGNSFVTKAIMSASTFEMIKENLPEYSVKRAIKIAENNQIMYDAISTWLWNYDDRANAWEFTKKLTKKYWDLKESIMEYRSMQRKLRKITNDNQKIFDIEDFSSHGCLRRIIAAELIQKETHKLMSLYNSLSEEEKQYLIDEPI